MSLFVTFSSRYDCYCWHHNIQMHTYTHTYKNTHQRWLQDDPGCDRRFVTRPPLPNSPSQITPPRCSRRSATSPQLPNSPSQVLPPGSDRRSVTSPLLPKSLFPLRAPTCDRRSVTSPLPVAIFAQRRVGPWVCDHPPLLFSCPLPSLCLFRPLVHSMSYTYIQTDRQTDAAAANRACYTTATTAANRADAALLLLLLSLLGQRIR